MSPRPKPSVYSRVTACLSVKDFLRMSCHETKPDAIAELFALDKGIAALCGRLLSELKEGRDSAEVASVVLANSGKSEGQGLLHALVQKHMSGLRARRRSEGVRWCSVGSVD